MSSIHPSEDASIKYAVVDWQNTNAIVSGAAFLPFTAVTYRDDDDWGSYPKLVRECRTWQAAAKLANRLNLDTINRLGFCRRNPTPPGCTESFSPSER